MTIILTIIASILGVSTLGLGFVYRQERERTKKLDSLKNIKKDILTFGDQKSQMENLIHSLKIESSKVQTLVSDLQNNKSQLEKQLNSLKTELAKTETILTKLTSQNSEEQQKVLQLQRQTQNAHNELTKLSKEVTQFRTEKEIAEKQFKTSKADLTELQIAVTKVKQQKDDFQTEISTLNRLIAEKKNSTISDISEITIVEPDINEVPRGEIKYIGYKPNTIFKQNTPTNYPFVSMPLENSVIKFPRKIAEGRIGIRGYKEADFDIYIKRYFCNNGALKFFNDRFLFISNNTKPYIPDHVLIDENNNLNLFIDIEIDEPYDGIGRLSTHEKGKDNSRNKYYNERGWLVIRFAEIQVHQNILGCCKYIAQVIKSINPKFEIHEDLQNATDIFNVPLWLKLEADKWAKEKYREEYLGISGFGQREGGNFNTSNLTANSDDRNSEAKVIQSEIPFEEETLSINILNSHIRDKRLKFFKDEHIYQIDGNPNTISGTTFIHKFFPDFDGPKIAPFVAKKRGITADEVLREWEIEGQKSADLGTELHSDIEQYFDNKKTNDKKEFQHFLELFKKIENLELYRTEWRIFDDILMLAGTADTIFRKKDGTFVIFDWKRSKEIKERGFPDFYTKETQKGIGVCEDIEDCNHQHYCLQLNLYKRILEEHYFGDGQVSEMYFVQLHPNFETYKLYKVPNMQNKINEMYNELLTIKN
jgi:hypothetical protein